ncbi:MAG TPA: hypothetical protein VGB87_01675, partial [Vicinamibacteria bacterium]
AASVLDTMNDWGVPREVLDRVADHAREARGPDAGAARAALYDMYSELDYWDGYVDWWNDQLKLAARVGAPLTLVTLLAALLCLRSGLVVPGIVGAGATGAGLSVLLRLPRLAVYGKLSDFWIRATGRYLSGTLAAVFGIGLLQTGLVVVPLPNGGDVTKVVAECAGACGVASQLLLFAIALALGFSERVITSFAESLVRVPARPRAAGEGERRPPAPRAP